MNRLMVISTLALAANVTLAGDFYGQFASSELESTAVSGYAVSAPRAASAIRVSLYDFAPDDASIPLAGTNRGNSPPLGQGGLTAYDELVLEDPDAGPISRAAHAPKELTGEVVVSGVAQGNQGG